MCKYCEIKDYKVEPCGKPIVDDKVDFGVLGTGYVEVRVAEWEKGDKTLSVVFSGISDDPIYVKEIKARYCPMCGRKLMEEKENVQ